MRRENLSQFLFRKHGFGIRVRILKYQPTYFTVPCRRGHLEMSVFTKKVGGLQLSHLQRLDTSSYELTYQQVVQWLTNFVMAKQGYVTPPSDSTCREFESSFRLMDFFRPFRPQLKKTEDMCQMHEMNLFHWNPFITLVRKDLDLDLVSKS